MLSRNKNDSFLAKTVTVIAEGVAIEGKVYSRGSTKIDGTINGEVISEKELTIGKEGKIIGNVKTTNAVIGGYFEGDMIAAGEVEITSNGRFIGNLTQKDALLTISKGGLFKGESIISDEQELFNISVPERPRLAEQQKPQHNTTQTPTTAQRIQFSQNTAVSGTAYMRTGTGEKKDINI